MAEIIRVPNFSEINLQEATILESDAASGQATITVINPTTYAQLDKLLIGMIGSETAEIRSIQSISSKTFTLSANLLNKHNKYEPVYRLYGDKIRLYRAANVNGTAPADSAFSLVDTVTMEGDDTTTDITDSSGGSGYWYKTTYYNSDSASETSLALSIAVRGGGVGHMASIESIRIESGLLDNQNIDDGRFAERRDQAEAEVNAALAVAGYTVPLQTDSPLVENIVRLLTAGYMMMQEYPTAEGEANPGKAKVKEARDLLKRIQNQELVLIDATGASLARTSQVSGWPDDTTETVGTDGMPEPFQMRMSKRF
jgi:hypothetical protein